MINKILKEPAKWLFNYSASILGKHKLTNDNGNLWILNYHRILPSSSLDTLREEPGMVVTPETFERHLLVMLKNFEVMQLSKWIELKEEGKELPKRACAITFDDGWLDNYQYALPILRKYNIPATIFLVSSLVENEGSFWPNRLIDLVCSESWHLFNALAPLVEITGKLKKGPISRESGAKLIDLVKSLPDRDIVNALDSLPTNELSNNKLMGLAEVQEMMASGLIEFGAHSSTHARLDSLWLTTEELLDEIVGSKKALERITGLPITLFCYPSGIYDSTTTTIVKEHYKAAVTTDSGIVNRSCDLALLPRIRIHEDASNTRTKFLARLSGWFLK